MHCQLLASPPCFLDDCCFADVYHLLNHVQFTQAVVPLRLGGQPSQSSAVFTLHVLNMSQPVVDQSQAVVTESRQHATTAIVSTDDDVSNPQGIDSKLESRQAIEIGVYHKVGDVSMNEHLARQQADNLIRRNATIGTANPQILRGLLAREPAEEIGISPGHFLGPSAVVRKELTENSHTASRYL